GADGLMRLGLPLGLLSAAVAAVTTRAFAAVAFGLGASSRFTRAGFWSLNIDDDGAQPTRSFNRLKAHVEQHTLRLGIEKPRHSENAVVLHRRLAQQRWVEEQHRGKIEIPLSQSAENFREMRVRVHCLKLWRAEIAQNRVV